MRRINRAITLTLLLSLSAQAAAPTTVAPAPGKVLFDRWCAECHAPGHGHPGTQQLERLKGAKLSVLESRTDLNVALIRYVVRNGQNAMPAYRPSEIGDAELDQVAAYLSRNAPAVKRRR